MNIESCVSNGVRILQYADDVLIYTSSHEKTTLQSRIQTSLDNLQTQYRYLGLDISPSKSEFVLFTKKTKVPTFTLNIASTPLTKKGAFKYLGVVFDGKSTWSEHVKHISGRCKKRINFLRTVAGVRWGSHPSTLVTIYKTTIRPILEYGSFTFMMLAKSHKIRLERLQWRALRICLGLMTSTHTSTLEVQAGILPLDLRWKESALRMLTKSFAGPSLTLRRSLIETLAANEVHPKAEMFNLVAGLQIDHNQFPCYVHSWRSQLFAPKISLQIFTTLRNINAPTATDALATFTDVVYELGPAKFVFTDGSKSEAGTGSALITPENMSETLRLQQPASVFTAEVSAIIMATEFIKRQPSGKFIIASDSMSSISALFYTRIAAKSNRLILKCRAELYNLWLNHYDVTILWVPAHVGIMGNEKADRAAKEAAISGPLSNFQPTWQDYFTLFPSQINQEWQDRWQFGELGRYFFSIRPAVQRHPWYVIFSGQLERPAIRMANRLAANHYCLKSHLNRIAILESPICERCGGYETADHIFFICPNLSHRDTLVRYLRKSHTDTLEIRNILALCRNANTIHLLHKYLIDNEIEI